jgi:hypothetical protein
MWIANLILYYFQHLIVCNCPPGCSNGECIRRLNSKLLQKCLLLAPVSKRARSGSRVLFQVSLDLVTILACGINWQCLSSNIQGPILIKLDSWWALKALPSLWTLPETVDLMGYLRVVDIYTPQLFSALSFVCFSPQKYLIDLQIPCSLKSSAFIEKNMWNGIPFPETYFSSNSRI